MNAIHFLHGSCIVTLLVTFIDRVQSVPPEYCLQNLNVSDCRGTPTPVAYYYKPGSRCDVATWRGCPTLNMFRDEVVCSHICIGRLINWSINELLHRNEIERDNDEPEDDMEDWVQEIELISSEEIEIINKILDKFVSVKEKFKQRFQESSMSSEATTAQATEVISSSETDSPTDSTTDTTTEEATTTESTMTSTEEVTITEPVTVATISEYDGSADEVITT